MSKPANVLLKMYHRRLQGKSAILVAKNEKKGYNTVFMEGLTNKDGCEEKG